MLTAKALRILPPTVTEAVRIAPAAKSAEIAAWGCALGLCVLTVHWYRYSRDVSQLTPVTHNLASLECAKWIHEPH